MDADLVGYILHTVAFQIEGLQRLPVASVKYLYPLTFSPPLRGPWPHPGHFVKSALLGVCFSTGFHAIRRVLFCREARTVSAFTLKAANLLNDMEPFRALLLSTASGFSP